MTVFCNGLACIHTTSEGSSQRAHRQAFPAFGWVPGERPTIRKLGGQQSFAPVEIRTASLFAAYRRIDRHHSLTERRFRVLNPTKVLETMLRSGRTVSHLGLNQMFSDAYTFLCRVLSKLPLDGFTLRELRQPPSSALPGAPQ